MNKKLRRPTFKNPVRLLTFSMLLTFLGLAVTVYSGRIERVRAERTSDPSEFASATEGQEAHHSSVFDLAENRSAGPASNGKLDSWYAGSQQTGQQPGASDGVWQEIDQKLLNTNVEATTAARAYRRVRLDRTKLTTILESAPIEFSEKAGSTQVQLVLPLADGTNQHFSIVESSIMAPELAAAHPEIKTYRGQGIEDPTSTTRFDWTPTGLHGIILTSKGTVLVEPYSAQDTENYKVYFQRDVPVSSFECSVTDAQQKAAATKTRVEGVRENITPAVISGTTLRTYRLAVAATAEYTQTYGGGTVNGGLAAITTTVNIIDGIYERELAIRLVLIANETSIIFTDSATDGYTSDNVGSLINENQTKLDSVIGTANYDIGHVFDGRNDPPGSFSFQGLAQIGSVCVAGLKGQGASITRSIQPSAVIAYYNAAHEMGHQFGATHTFNAATGNCASQRAPSTAYEPGTGTTMMGYRFTCGAEDLMSSDTYFHDASLGQIIQYTTTGDGSSCPTIIGTTNHPPVVDAGPVHTIPQGTPFTLTATGSDPDGDAVTFCWEEFDLGNAAPPDTDDGTRPIFRSFAPVTSPSRTFPQLSDVLSGSATFGESLPVTTRTMNFQATARDNRSGGGGINSSSTQVNVRADSGPFTVTQPASAANLSTNSSSTVAWSVANTSNAPVSCSSVKVLLSTDGGNSFPIVLANDTPNNGSATVTIPGTPTSNGRIKVAANGNIFFNISRNFTITGSANAVPTISSFSPGSGSVGNTVTITGSNFISPTAVNFNGIPSTFTVNSTTQIVATIPAGATTGPISVTTPSGTATSATNFTVAQSTSSLQFSATNYSVGEGDGSVTVTVTRTGDTSGIATVDFSTSDGTATQNRKYEVTSGTLSFAAGDTSKTFNVLIVDEAFVEGTQSFSANLSNPTGSSLGTPSTATISITDNDSAASISPAPKRFATELSGGQETPPTGSIGNGIGLVLLNQNESSALAGFVFSNLTSAETAAHIHGPATPGVAAPILFTLPTTNPVTNFLINPSSAQVSDLKAGLDYMNVHSSNFPGGEIRGQLGWNPTLEENFLVRQQYLDFLSREPDSGGFNFWVGTITPCQADAQCFHDKSIAVSDAFFFEPEFHQTAGFVFLAYRAAYGNTQPFPITDGANQTEANKLPDYHVFNADRSRVVGGVSLSAAQQAFTNLFVTRTEFTNRYPLASFPTGPTFVDATLANINTSDGVDLTSQRQALIDQYNNAGGGNAGRAQVLYRLALDDAQNNPINNLPFINAEYNRQFALTLYFGYLRRDPDIGGFLFWQGQINSAPVANVPKQQALVCSFITSTEYQLRFGPNAPRSNAECQ